MRYIDTSILVAYLTPEPHSTVAEAFMLSAGAALAVSSWTEVELLSALGTKVRTQKLNKAQADDVLDTYARTVAPHLRCIPATNADHKRAMTLLRCWNTGLRAGDGLHLAIASAHSGTVFTFDRAMSKSGTALGVRVQLMLP